MRLDRLLYQLHRHLSHLGCIASNSDNQASLSPRVSLRQNIPIKKRHRTRRAAKDNIRAADLVSLEALVLAVRRRQDPKLRVRPALARLDLGRYLVEAPQHGAAGRRKAPVDHVHVLDGAASEQKRETHVPVGLLAAAEDGDGLDVVALVD